MLPSRPKIDQHVTAAGMQGSGKTWAMLDMLSRRGQIPWLVIDHKRDSSIKKLNLPPLSLAPIMLPTSGFWHIAPNRHGDIDREGLENLLHRVFTKGKFGVYVDEGHLMGFSPMIRKILVAGRDKKVPLMWISQRAQSIDPFIWSQCNFYRAFKLQTPNDRKRFNENFMFPYEELPKFHSHYFDGEQGAQFELGPAAPLEETINRIDQCAGTVYRAI